MHTWCPPSRVEYGSRALSSSALSLVRELFFQFSIFARETRPRHLPVPNHGHLMEESHVSPCVLGSYTSPIPRKLLGSGLKGTATGVAKPC